ncbi:ALP1-like protein isoform X1 [Tanacetum coccineum]
MLWSWFFGNAWEALIVCTENGKKLFVDLAYCVLVGSSANNDINVLDNSSLFDDILDDKAPVAPYVRTWVERCETQRRKNKEMRDREMHLSLQQNLMEHIWQQVDHEDEDEEEDF